MAHPGWRARCWSELPIALASRRARRPEGMSMNSESKNSESKPKQLLHLVIGGELDSIDGVEFKDLDKVEMVGVYPNYASAYAVWRAKAQQTVDNAQMRYFIVHLHRLMDPDATPASPKPASPR
jgi:hypothetical protein